MGSRRSSADRSEGLKRAGDLEVWEYSVTQCDSRTCESGTFVDYINAFRKLKAEVSECPNWVRSPEDDERYIESFCGREGVQLDRNAIKPNAAKRGLAKLCFNSHWGKLAERQNRIQTKLILDTHEMYRFLTTPYIEVVNLLFSSDSVVWASWRYRLKIKFIACVILTRLSVFRTLWRSHASVLLKRQTRRATSVLRHRKRYISSEGRRTFSDRIW